MRKTEIVAFFVLLLVILCGCYHDRNRGRVRSDVHANVENDTDGFARTHHYSQNYNFVVKADSLVLLCQQPEEGVSLMPTDSLTVHKGENLVVVDMRILKNDMVDSVWIQVARDQYTFGWVHECVLLKNVVPDDPISQFISTFSDIHLLIFLVVIILIAVCYLLHNILRKKANIVHFNDIQSFYPTLLALVVAYSAAFYSSIQLFAPDTWQNFYFHPTLNPFGVPKILSVFLVSVWAMTIIAIATIDDVYHKLDFGGATLYISGLFAVCAINYIVFSVATMYYIGYVLLVAYTVYALMAYFKHNYYKYVCGKCGTRMLKKGVCPNCGAYNE